MAGMVPEKDLSEDPVAEAKVPDTYVVYAYGASVFKVSSTVEIEETTPVGLTSRST